MYIKHDGDNFIILSFYIDDILLTDNNKEFMNTIKRWLTLNFEIRDMEEVAYILGIKIYNDRSRRLLTLSYKPYIKKIL